MNKKFYTFILFHFVNLLTAGDFPYIKPWRGPYYQKEGGVEEIEYRENLSRYTDRG
jgi:hypothetical protein